MCLVSLHKHSRGDDKALHNQVATLETSTTVLFTKPPHKPTDSDIEESIEEVHMVETTSVTKGKTASVLVWQVNPFLNW